MPRSAILYGAVREDFTDELTSEWRAEKGERGRSNTTMWESLFLAKEERGGHLVGMEPVRGKEEIGSSKGWVAGREIKYQRGRTTG